MWVAAAALEKNATGCSGLDPDFKSSVRLEFIACATAVNSLISTRCSVGAAAQGEVGSVLSQTRPARIHSHLVRVRLRVRY